MNKNDNTTENVITALLGGLTTDAVLKTVKASLPQGSSFQGEVTVKIPFTLNKGEDGEAAPTASILSQAVLAKAMVYSGVTAEAFKAGLRKAATEALLADQQVGVKLSAEDERIAKVIAEVQAEVIAALPKQKRNGRVTVKGTPEIVNADITQTA